MLKIAAIFYSIPRRNWLLRLIILAETMNTPSPVSCNVCEYFGRRATLPRWVKR
jgi:hypothetical protein